MAATGTGPTKLAAFDAALRRSGVANFNLVCLSSVIPPGRTVVDCGTGPLVAPGEWGDRLYVVLAEQRVDQPGAQAWAGIGWVQEPRSQKGLLVEHEGSDESQVRADIKASLESLCEGRPETFGPATSVVQGAACDDEPTCALVMAVFESSPWAPV